MRRRWLLFDIDHVTAADAATSEHHVRGGLAVATRYLIMQLNRMRAATAIHRWLGARNRLNTGNDVDICVDTRHHDIQATRQ